MKSGMKKTLLATATAGIIGMSGQAFAEVHAVSKLLIQDLAVVISDGTPGSFDYTFTTGATANLNNTGVNSDGASCGTVTGPACSIVAPVLSYAANGTGSDSDRAVGDFTIWGPNSGETYANAASEIGDASLSTGNLTDTSQIAEVEIQGTGIGDSTSTVGSRTVFSLQFDVNDAGSISWFFNSDVFLQADIDTLNPDADPGFGATAKVDTIFTVTGDDTLVNWRANGSASGSFLEFQDCSGATCTESFDTVSLNTQRTLSTTNPDSNVFQGLGFYAVALTDLAEGGYTLQITSQLFADAEQRVPVPGVLGLMGIGLAGLGFRLRKQKSA